MTATTGLGPGEMLPYFDLPGSRGGRLNPWQYKGRRNLVLVFAGRAGRDLLRAFASRYPEYVEEEAEVLGIAPLAPAEVARLAADVGRPYPLLADEDGAVHARYGAVTASGAPGQAVYLADRYGEVQARWLGGRQALPGQEEVLDHLRFVELACPE